MNIFPSELNVSYPQKVYLKIHQTVNCMKSFCDSTLHLKDQLYIVVYLPACENPILIKSWGVSWRQVSDKNKQ